MRERSKRWKEDVKGKRRLELMEVHMLPAMVVCRGCASFLLLL